MKVKQDAASHLQAGCSALEIEQSLQEYKAILDTAEDVAKLGSWKWDLHSRKVTWSDGMFRLFGVDRESFGGDVERIIGDRIHPDDVAAVHESNRRVLEEGVPQPISYRIVLPNGTERIVWAQGKLLYDDDGQPRFLSGYVQDITERVRAENRILQLQRMYAILSQVNQVIMRVKEQGELFQRICDVAVGFGGFDLAWVGLLDEASGEIQPAASHGWDIHNGPFPHINIHQEEYKSTLTATAIRTSRVVTSENIHTDERLQKFRGQMTSHKYYASAIVPFRCRGRIIGILSLGSPEKGVFQDEAEVRLLEEMSVDISFALDNIENEKERRQAEKALQESENRYRDLVETSGDAIFINCQGTISFINRRGLEMFGAAVYDQVIGRSPDDFFHPDFHALGRERIRQVLVDQVSIPSVEQKIVTLEGRTVPVEVTTSRVIVNNVPAVQVILHDITERKQAEDKLRQSEEKLRTVLEHTPDVVLTLDKELRIQFINRTLGGLSMDQALGSVCLDYARPEHRGLLKEKIQHAFRTGCPDAFEVQGQGTMNTPAWYSIRLAPIKTDNAVNQVLMITTNITERKQAEERLRESEERYRLISENTADVIWVLDPLAGRFKYVSPSVEKLSGYTPAEVMEQPVSAALTPDSFQRVANLLAEHLPAFIAKGSGSESFVTEVDQPRRDGSIVNTEVTTTVMFNQQGEVEVIGVSRDITERKQTEQAVRENEERLRLSLQAASQGLYDLNVQTGNAIVNREYAEMLGYEYETFVETNTSWIGRLHPDDREITAKAYADYIDGLRPDYRVEFRQRTRDDGWKWILSLGKVIAYDEEGKPLRMLGTHTDITERKQAEEALKQNEHVLRLFVEHSPASIAMFDRDMRYIVASRRYITDYRLPHQDLTGRSHYEVFPEIPEHWKENHRRCLAGAVEKMEEDPFPREDGSLDWVRWEIRPWYEETDRIGGIILFSEVITDRKQIQDDLRLLNVSLEQRVTERTMELSYANRAKDEFLANMSHELRTPLNAILGLSESLLEQRRGPLNERQVQSIELVASSGKHLLSLINDILEVSKIEAGRLDLHTDSVSVKELCASSLNFIRELALKKLITVDFACDDSISIIEADPQRLKQILINLLTNAVKFTPERGRVGLQVSTNAARDQVLFSITDTGIGIAQEDLKKLFTPFTQLDSSLARQYAGTGLGLSLVQKLTEAHGGRIQVESEAGRGSRFTVVLPLTRKPGKQAFEEGNAHYAVSGQEPASPRDLSTKHITVLLVEDNHVNSDMMRTYVESYGYTVLIAQNGEEVLQKVEEITPHIIVMDIQMPKLDGLETTRRLRQDTRFTTTPIIALTALVMPGDRERCLEAGANEYLSKPVSLKTLISLIEKLT